MAVRRVTDHNVDSAIALKCKLEKSDLVVPTDDVAFDKRSFSAARAYR